MFSRTRTIAALAATAAAGIVLAGCASTAPARTPGAASTPTPAPQASPTAPASPAATYNAWSAATGQHVRTVIIADSRQLSAGLGQLETADRKASAALTAGGYSAAALNAVAQVTISTDTVKADGAQLAADATDAQAQPAPPIDPGDWRASLSLMASAGDAFARGDVTGGGSLAQAATTHLDKFSAAVSAG